MNLGLLGRGKAGGRRAISEGPFLALGNVELWGKVGMLALQVGGPGFETGEFTAVEK